MADQPVTPLLTPAQKQYLLLVAVSMLLGWLGHYSITPAPLPPIDLTPVTQRQDAQAEDIQELKRQNATLLRAAGVPHQQ